MKESRLENILVDNIDEELGNIRTVTEEIDELAADIKSHGIINPITVVQSSSVPGYYHVIAGHRRLKAARRAGLKTVPCHIIADGSDEYLREVALSENVARLDMTPYEECLAVKHLLRSRKDIKSVAKRLGRTVRWVAVRKKIADAGEECLAKVGDGLLTLRAAEKLAHLPDEVFSRVVATTWKLDERAAESALDRIQHDLTEAKFDTTACQKCGKCSNAQADLFDDGEGAWCLDSGCWDEKTGEWAERRVEELEASGIKATTEKEWRHCIAEWNKNRIEQAKAAGVKPRVLVDPLTGEESEFYDERDFPDYREESDEEAEARHEEERKAQQAKEDLEDAKRHAIAEALKTMSGDVRMGFVALMNDDIDEDRMKELVENPEEDGYYEVRDFRPGTTPEDIARIAKDSLEGITHHLYGDNLDMAYRIYTGKDPSELG